MSNYLYGLWNRKVQYHINKGSPIIHILSRINPTSLIETLILKFILISPTHPRLDLPRDLHVHLDVIVLNYSHLLNFYYSPHLDFLHLINVDTLSILK